MKLALINCLEVPSVTCLMFFFPHFPELIELFVHNLFYFRRALNYSETLKYFTANSRDLEAVRRVFDEFLSLGDERGGGYCKLGGGTHGVEKELSTLFSVGPLNSQLLLKCFYKLQQGIGVHFVISVS